MLGCPSPGVSVREDPCLAPPAYQGVLAFLLPILRRWTTLASTAPGSHPDYSNLPCGAPAVRWVTGSRPVLYSCSIMLTPASDTVARETQGGWGGGRKRREGVRGRRTAAGPALLVQNGSAWGMVFASVEDMTCTWPDAKPTVDGTCRGWRGPSQGDGMPRDDIMV